MILNEENIADILNNRPCLIKLIPSRQCGRTSHEYTRLKSVNFEWYSVVKVLSENLTSSKKRAAIMKWEFDLTLPYLASLWFKQKGRCALTDIIMDCVGGSLINKNPYRCSIDRISSNRGYVKGNVRLLCHWANNSKSTWNDKIFNEFVSNTYLNFSKKSENLTDK